jgi:hypothetical protein
MPKEIKFNAHCADSFGSANGVTQPKGNLKNKKHKIRE